MLEKLQKDISNFDIDDLNELLYSWLKEQGNEFVSGTFPTNGVFFGILKDAIKEKRNILLQGTANNEKFLGNLESAANNGYIVCSEVVAISPERAALQAMERYNKEKELTGHGRICKIEKVVNDAKALTQVIETQENYMKNGMPRGGHIITVLKINADGKYTPVHTTYSALAGKDDSIIAQLANSELVQSAEEEDTSTIEALREEQRKDKEALCMDPNLPCRLSKLKNSISTLEEKERYEALVGLFQKEEKEAEHDEDVR